MTAAELLALLTVMAERVPLHKLTVRVEVSDDHYDKDLSEDDVYERAYGDDRYLIFHGR